LNISEGRLLPHESEERDEWEDGWRLRDLQNHPIDPNWETGQYLKCHALARNNKKLKEGTIIFDLVGMKGQGYSRFIRSAFVISKIENGTLYFDSFFFADKDPLRSPKNIIRHPYGAILEKKAVVQLLKKMEKNHYHEYKIGQRPKSIKKRYWNYMLSRASVSKTRRHICH